MLSEDWPKPLLASMKVPILVMPTVCMRDCRTGFFVGMKMEFMGLSDIPFPTYWLSRISGIFIFSRSFRGPIPLSSNS